MTDKTDQISLEDSNTSAEHASESDSNLPASSSSVPTHLVALGASAGGLESLERFFRAMPHDTGMAFAVVQHLSPDYKSMMSELMGRFTKMPVSVVRETEQLLPNHIYLIAPGMELTVKDTTLFGGQRPDNGGGLFLPINTLFRSLAASWGDRAIAIVMSGTGSDGTHGSLDVRDAGGVVIAETPETARFISMPQSVISTGCADAILAPADMPQYLIDLGKNTGGVRLIDHTNDSDEPRPGTVDAILDLLRREYNIDFNHYKYPTIARRIEHRLVTGAPGESRSLKEFYDDVSTNADALNRLYKDLLIGVTRFFRDPEAFMILRNRTIPDLLNRVDPDKEFRVWVCGCSTGEEAYSIAALLLDAMSELKRPPLLKVLATDLHEASLQVAAAGVYAEPNFSDMPRELRNRYFEEISEGRFRARPDLRRSLIFSRHNLLNDPPFTHIHLVSCRNLLIYLKPPAQSRAIASFHYALELGGVMFLGASESVSDELGGLEVVDRHWKMFRKTANARNYINYQIPRGFNGNLHESKNSRKSDPMANVYDALLDRFVPSGILVNEKADIIHVFGDAPKYLHPVGGRFSGTLNKMLSQDISLPLISAIRNSSQQMREIVLAGLTLPGNDETRLQIRVVPVRPSSGQLPYFMIVLEPLPGPPKAPSASTDVTELNLNSEMRTYIQDMERELERTRETLQSTVEELQTSNEELQASNEELLASNEELQSTNEELHSVNEELHSVNSEHEAKIAELNDTSSTLRNLIQSTETATIFLDLDGKISLFTPKAIEIFDLMPEDVGRELNSFKCRVGDETLWGDISDVIAKKTEIARFISVPDTRSFLRRCSPLSDLLDHPSGVVINYTDTTEISRSNEALSASEARFETILQTVPNAIILIDDKQDVVLANDRAKNMFDEENSALLLGRRISELLKDYPGTWQQLLAPPEDNAPNVQSEVTFVRHDGSTMPVILTSNVLELEKRRYTIVVLTDNRINKQSEKARKKALDEALSLVQARSNFLANMSHEIRTPLSGIIGYSQIGLRPRTLKNEEKTRNCFEKISDSGHHLLQVINDVLDFSKIDSEKVEIEMQPCELRHMVDKALDNQRRRALDKNLTIETGFDFADEKWILCDSMRFRQILDNLLSNAIKFTDKGGISVEVHVQAGNLILRISDTGIGIAEEDKDRLFNPFEQADNSSTRRHGGTGLGLAITNRLVTLMGGHLEMSSKLGEGTTFTISMPAPDAEFPGDNITSPDCLSKVKGLNLFIAEDDPINQNVIAEMLDDVEIKAQIFSNGLALVERLEEIDADGCDLVLMDIQMPVMNGLDATRRLKKRFKNLPVIGFSAHAFTSQINQAMDAGMDDYITKPFELNPLCETLVKNIKQPSK